jgi:hypothetical protein
MKRDRARTLRLKRRQPGGAMAQDPNKPPPAGQQQMHTSTKTDPATGSTQSKQVTQDEWKNGPYQDEGWKRSDDPEATPL